MADHRPEVTDLQFDKSNSSPVAAEKLSKQPSGQRRVRKHSVRLNQACSETTSQRKVSLQTVYSFRPVNKGKTSLNKDGGHKKNTNASSSLLSSTARTGSLSRSTSAPALAPRPGLTHRNTSREYRRLLILLRQIANSMKVNSGILIKLTQTLKTPLKVKMHKFKPSNHLQITGLTIKSLWRLVKPSKLLPS